MVILDLLHNILNTMRGAVLGADEEQKRAQSQQRHSTIDAFFERWGRLLTLVPLIVILAVASTNMPAAIWTAFGIETFLILTDFYRSRYNKTVVFPDIVRTAMLISYIICIILFYVLVPPLGSQYVSVIVITTITGFMVLSLVLMYPFTIQYSAPHVDETVRKSTGFFRLNQILTLFWCCIMGIATGCTWGSLRYPNDSAASIVLGIVIPIVVPILGQLLTPLLVNYLKSLANKDKKDDDENDNEESKGLLEKA